MEDEKLSEPDDSTDEGGGGEPEGGIGDPVAQPPLKPPPIEPVPPPPPPPPPPEPSGDSVLPWYQVAAGKAWYWVVNKLGGSTDRRPGPQGGAPRG
ncbi:MAG TPA: hypothetical protein VK745_18315 [Polyangiaceae bacterium]|nr:hypothetical protein [Polyangiaceae bacterium]